MKLKLIKVRVIIAGSRGITDIQEIHKAVDAAPFGVAHVISGGARGVDSLAEIFAKEQALPLTVIKADWDIHGKSAGYKRNCEMAKIADALIAIWDGESKGTKHMIDIMKSMGKPVFIWRPRS